MIIHVQWVMMNLVIYFSTQKMKYTLCLTQACGTMLAGWRKGEFITSVVALHPLHLHIHVYRW